MFKPVASPSIIDAAYQHVVNVWVIFRDVDPRRAILHRWLKPSYQHVEVWQHIPPGAWLRFDTSVEMIHTEVYAHAPWELILPEWNPKCYHVTRGSRHGAIREPFFVGPMTCVTMAAALLGVHLPFLVRTPYQFYKHLVRLGDINERK